MVKKFLPTFILVFGMVLISLGTWYSFRSVDDQNAATIAPPSDPQEIYETYTLENDRYEGEFTPQTEFRLLNETDSSLLISEEVPTVNRHNAAGFAREFDILDQMEEDKPSGKGILPGIMVFSGAFFLTFGFILLRRKGK